MAKMDIETVVCCGACAADVSWKSWSSSHDNVGVFVVPGDAVKWVRLHLWLA